MKSKNPLPKVPIDITTQPNIFDETYYDHFLKSSTETSTIEYDVGTTEEVTTSGDYESEFLNYNFTDFNDTDVFNVSADRPIAHDTVAGNRLENGTNFMVDVEELFVTNLNGSLGSVRFKRNVPVPVQFKREGRGTILVTCSNIGGFTSSRERWWYIAIANCGSGKGLDITYKFRMTNGPAGDFWHEHFSADEMCKYLQRILNGNK